MSNLQDLWQVREITTKFWYKEQEAKLTANRLSKTKNVYITTVALRTPFHTMYALTNRFDPNIIEINGVHHATSN